MLEGGDAASFVWVLPPSTFLYNRLVLVAAASVLQFVIITSACGGGRGAPMEVRLSGQDLFFFLGELTRPLASMVYVITTERVDRI